MAAILELESRLSPWWLVIGAAIPDLIDKPLAMIGLVELFHTVGHSAFLGIVLLPTAFLSRSALAVTIGWISHLALDTVHVIVNGRPTDALFLFWPVAVPPDPFALAPVPFLLQYLWTPSFWLEVGIWATLGVVFRHSLSSISGAFKFVPKRESD